MQEYYIKTSGNICFGYLLESPHRGDSNKYPKQMLCEETRIKQGLSYRSFYPYRILYNSKFILMATSLGTNDIVVRGFTVYSFSAGSSVSSTNKFLHTPLHLAAISGDNCLAVLQYLIDKGANIEAYNHEHQTPLHKAALFNNLECMKVLLEAYVS